MPRSSVAVPYLEFVQRAARYDQVIKGLSAIDPSLQKLLAELVMMRIFDVFMESLAGIAARLACGATYADGVNPKLLTVPARSTQGAMNLFATHGRPKFQQPKWSKLGYITTTTELVLDKTDHFLTACSANASVIAEMQAVRNRIAHTNGNSRVAYAKVIRRLYGAKLNQVTPGMLLLSTRFAPSRLDTYLASCRVILKGCSRS